MKKIFRYLWGILEIIIIVYAIIITSFILCKNKYGYSQFGNYTFVTINEDRAEFLKDGKPGGLLVVKYTKNIHPGDIIYFYSPRVDDYVVKTAGVTDVTNANDAYLFTLNDKDKATVSSLRVLGKYANQYPNYGKILDVLESKIGFLLLVLLPIMIVFIYQVYQFIIILRYDEVDDDVKENKEDVEVL